MYYQLFRHHAKVSVTSNFALIANKSSDHENSHKNITTKWKKLCSSSVAFQLKVYSDLLKLLLGTFVTLDLVSLMIGATGREIEEKIPLYFLARNIVANFTFLDLAPLLAIFLGQPTTRHKAYRNLVYKWLWMWYDFDVDRITDTSSLGLACIGVAAVLRSMITLVGWLRKNWVARQQHKSSTTGAPSLPDSSNQQD